jgi:hypothetical protein
MIKILPIFVFGALAVGVLFGGYLSCVGVRNIWRGLASTRWPKTTGVVTTSTIESTTSVDNKTGRTDVDYCANLLFRYNVNGRGYTTQLLAFGQTLGSGDPTEAQLRHLRYPVGAEATITYNPGDPSIAAVEPGFHAVSLWVVMAGLMFSLPCIMAGAIYATSLGGANDNVGMTIGIGIFAALFAILGIAALTFGLINLWLGHASESWPKTAGVITYQKVDGAEVDTEQIDTRRMDDDHPSTARSVTYTDYLVFAYDVDGKKRFSNLRRFGQVGGGTEADAEALKARYPADSPVAVSYSPDNPDLGVLEPGISSDAYWMPGIGAGILLFVLAICIWIIPSVARS